MNTLATIALMILLTWIGGLAGLAVVSLLTGHWIIAILAAAAAAMMIQDAIIDNIDSLMDDSL